MGLEGIAPIWYSLRQAYLGKIRVFREFHLSMTTFLSFAISTFEIVSSVHPIAVRISRLNEVPVTGTCTSGTMKIRGAQQVAE